MLTRIGLSISIVAAHIDMSYHSIVCMLPNEAENHQSNVISMPVQQPTYTHHETSNEISPKAMHSQFDHRIQYKRIETIDNIDIADVNTIEAKEAV